MSSKREASGRRKPSMAWGGVMKKCTDINDGKNWEWSKWNRGSKMSL